MSSDATDPKQPSPGETVALSRADGADLVVAALDHLRGFSPSGGDPSGTPSVARQKEGLREWARDVGLLLNPDQIIPRLKRGGQEHDWFRQGDCIFKANRDGVFSDDPSRSSSSMSGAWHSAINPIEPRTSGEISPCI